MTDHVCLYAVMGIHAPNHTSISSLMKGHVCLYIDSAVDIYTYTHLFHEVQGMYVCVNLSTTLPPVKNHVDLGTELGVRQFDHVLLHVYKRLLLCQKLNLAKKISGKTRLESFFN